MGRVPKWASSRVLMHKASVLRGHPGEKVHRRPGRIARSPSGICVRFAKWRALIAIDHGLPSWSCIEPNAYALARYAALCREEGLVPAVEPEVVMDGEHTLEQCCEVTGEVMRTVFSDRTFSLRSCLCFTSPASCGLISIRPDASDLLRGRTVSVLSAHQGRFERQSGGRRPYYPRGQHTRERDACWLR